MRKNIVGGLELLLSSVVYGSYGIFYRMISDFGEFSQGYLRSAVIMLILLTVLIFNKRKWKMYTKKDLKWFLVWNLPSALVPLLSFQAFNHLPVGLVFYLLYASMIISSFISGLVFFKEKINLEKVVSFILVIVGITFIYGTDITFITNIYVLFALLNGFLIGLWNTLTKKLSGKYSEEQMLFTDNIVTVTVYLILSIIKSESLPNIINYSPYLWLIVFSVFTLIAGVLIVRGFAKVEAQIGSLIVPMEIIFGSLAGYVFFKETLSFNLYIGGLFIFFAAVFPYVFQIFTKNVKYKF